MMLTVFFLTSCLSRLWKYSCQCYLQVIGKPDQHPSGVRDPACIAAIGSAPHSGTSPCCALCLSGWSTPAAQLDAVGVLPRVPVTGDLALQTCAG